MIIIIESRNNTVKFRNQIDFIMEKYCFINFGKLKYKFSINQDSLKNHPEHYPEQKFKQVHELTEKEQEDIKYRANQFLYNIEKGLKDPIEEFREDIINIFILRVWDGYDSGIKITTVSYDN